MQGEQQGKCHKFVGSTKLEPHAAEQGVGIHGERGHLPGLAKLVFIPALVCVYLESSRAGHTVASSETFSVRSEFISSSMTVF